MNSMLYFLAVGIFDIMTMKLHFSYYSFIISVLNSQILVIILYTTKYSTTCGEIKIFKIQYMNIILPQLRLFVVCFFINKSKKSTAFFMTPESHLC